MIKFRIWQRSLKYRTMILYKVARGIVSGVCHTLFRIKIEGRENIPTDKNFIICSNHISLFDPPMVGLSMPFPVRFMAKEELFSNKLFGGLLKALGAFPIKRGKSDVGALKAAINILKSGENLVIFPEGKRSKDGNLNRGKSGAALIAIKAGVNILPVGIDGKYGLFKKMTVRIGKPVILEEYFGKKLETAELQKLTSEKLMPVIADLAGVETYESRNS